MKGADLERAVAAILHASGWFLLRGATDETFQAFELDVLGYRFDWGVESSVVVESKGGKSGFNHLWKLVGLKTHLGIQRGVLLADEDEPLHDLKRKMARQHEVAVIANDPAYIAEQLLAAGVIGEEPDPNILYAWLRCLRVEDAFIKILYDKELWRQYETIKVAKQQLQELTSKAWLEPDPWRQAARLYTLYAREEKIARAMAREMDPSAEAFRQALYYGALPEVQACFYLEHRKRLAVAFAATRCAVLKEYESRWEDMAPASFRAMVARIRDEEAWYLPTVLQVYFLGFGAMLCLDAIDRELEEIGKQALCTPAEARHALELFEELFPTVGGWFYEGYELSRLKLVPLALRGATTWMREAIYGHDWTAVATPGQFSVVGTTAIRRAVLAEDSLQPSKSLRRRLRRSTGS
jgi:hypothetical protein